MECTQDGLPLLLKVSFNSTFLCIIWKETEWEKHFFLNSHIITVMFIIIDKTDDSNFYHN